MIVPFPPAGSSDVIAQTLATPLAKALGRNVVGDNRPGGGTVIGTELAARAPADGHTLLVCLASMTINPAIRSKLPYDTLKDFAAIGRIATQPYVFVSSMTAPPSTFIELLAMARARPGELSAGTSGTGTGQHLVVELLNQIGFAVLNHPDVAPYVQSGSVLGRRFAAASGARL